jgi:hypothetical protein
LEGCEGRLEAVYGIQAGLLHEVRNKQDPHFRIVYKLETWKTMQMMQLSFFNGLGFLILSCLILIKVRGIVRPSAGITHSHGIKNTG